MAVIKSIYPAKKVENELLPFLIEADKKRAKRMYEKYLQEVKAKTHETFKLKP